MKVKLSLIDNDRSRVFEDEIDIVEVKKFLNEFQELCDKYNHIAKRKDKIKTSSVRDFDDLLDDGLLDNFLS